MACRSRQKAEAARTLLLELFDTEVRKSELHKHNPHVQNFRQNIDIYIHILDLASVRSVLTFCDELKNTCVVSSSPQTHWLMEAADILTSHTSFAMRVLRRFYA